MSTGNGVAAGENLRLDRARDVHEVDATSVGLSRFWRWRDHGLGTAPTAKYSFDCAEHSVGIEITNHEQQCIFRRIEIAVDGQEIVALVSGDLLFGRRDLRVGMGSEEHFAEALAGEEAGLRAVELYFFKFLAALTFKFGFRKGRFACKLVDELQERLGEFGKARETDSAIVRAGMGRKVGAEAAEVFFDLAAGAFCGSGAQDGSCHLSEAGRAICGGCVP